MHHIRQSTYTVLLLTGIIMFDEARADITNVPVDDTTNQVTLYFIRPPINYDWSTPTSAAQSGLSAYFTFEYYQNWPGQSPVDQQSEWDLAEHQLGHTNIHLQCAGYPDFWGGMTNALTQPPDDVSSESTILSGGGVEVLWGDHAGRFYSEEEIKAQWPQYFHNKRMAMLTIRVSSATCERMYKFVTEFSDKNQGAPKFGGLATKARYGWGAGCTEFGIAFLDVAGVLDSDLEKQISRDIWAPWDLVRTKDQDPTVSVFDMGLWGDQTSWAQPNADRAIHLHFYDPQLGNAWVKAVAKGKIKPVGMVAAYKEPINWAAPGTPAYALKSTVDHVVLDRTRVPTPTDPIWWDPSTDPRQFLPNP